MPDCPFLSARKAISCFDQCVLCATPRRRFGRSKPCTMVRALPPNSFCAISARVALSAVALNAGMDRRRLDTVRPQSRELVVHQCLQWRYDDGGLFEDERRDLIAQRLARSRRHHGQHILPSEDEIDDLILPRAKGRVAEDFVKNP